MISSEAKLWKNPSFLKYYLFNILTYLGSGMSVVALPIYIYGQTESPFYTSLVVVFTGVPYLLFGLFAGVLADRGNRKKMIVICNMFSAVILASVPIAVIITEGASIMHLLAVALCTSTAFVWCDAASHGALLQLVGRNQLVAANSALISTSTAISIGSPILAGIIIHQFGPEWAIGMDAVCYGMASVIIIFIKGSFQAQRLDLALKGRTLLQKLGTDIKEGLRYIWSEPLIRSLTAAGFGNSFVGGAVVGLIVVFGAEVMGFEKNTAQMSILFTCGSIGGLVSSLALPLLRKQFKPGRITLFSLFLSGFVLLGIAYIRSPYFAYVLYTLWHFSNALVIINGITLRQQLTPDHLQGRVHASGRMIAYGGSPIGSLLGGVAAVSLSVQFVYMLLGFIMILVFLVGLRSPLAK